MTSRLILIIVLIGVESVFGQSLKAKFLLRVLPDNGWFLQFNKDNSYRYYVWNGIAASDATLDTGRYQIDGSCVSLISSFADSVKSPLSNRYYLTKVSVKKYESIGYIPRIEKFSLIGRRYLLLTKEPFDESKVVSYHPKDRIHQFDCAEMDSVRYWVEQNRLPYYGYEPGTLYDGYWTSALNIDGLEIGILDNDSDVKEVFYKVGMKVFVTPFYSSKNQHRKTTTELRRSGNLTRKQVRQAIEAIDKVIKKKENTNPNKP